MTNAVASAADAAVDRHAAGGAAGQSVVEPAGGLRPPTAGATRCLHCEQPLARGGGGEFCCLGCATVHAALKAGGFERYYELRSGTESPIPDLHLERCDRTWLSPLQARVDEAVEAVTLRLSVQGIRCAACVWVIEQVFARRSGGLRIEVNPGAGQLGLRVVAPFSLEGFASQLAELGYLVGPAQARVAPSHDLLLRAGLVTAFAANAMLFAVAVYLGLEVGPLRRFLHGVNFGLSALAVLVGAPVFIGQAWVSLRSGVLHLDLPIAMGMLLSMGAAAWAFVSGQDAYGYYDSLAVFVALMLWGRYLQGRVAEQNRQRLLPYQAETGLTVRQVVGAQVQDLPLPQIQVGDQLLIGPGACVPVAATLLGAATECSLDWIRGEPAPQRFEPGQVVDAGAVCLGSRAVLVRAEQPYAESEVRALLAAPSLVRQTGSFSAGRFAPIYVVAVLGAAVLGCLRAYWQQGTLEAGLAVATAVCVVSCPCSIGLAVPLAQEIIQAKLRRVGLFIRDGSFLTRAAHVDAIAFDKTGTLTTGLLRLDNPALLGTLSAPQRQVLFQMVAGSAHPHAVAVRRALEQGHGADALLSHGSGFAEEVPGAGLEWKQAGQRYRLGRSGWAAGAEVAGQSQTTVFACAGQQLARFAFVEEERPELEGECSRLRALGVRLSILSGDGRQRVLKLAQRLGIPQEQAFAEQRPADKARYIAESAQARTLMLGDGMNDNLALEKAFVAGTPSLDRAAVTTRADFYYVAQGLRPITAALRAARDLRRLRRRAYVFFGVYNLVVVVVAVLGFIQPWVAAVLMPSSSIASVALMSYVTHRASRSWMS